MYVLGKNLFIRQLDELVEAETRFWDGAIDASSALRQAFLSRPFAVACARALGPVVVLVGYGSEGPAFLLPLQRRPGFAGKLGVFEPVGGELADYFGLLASPGVCIQIRELLGATQGAVNAVLFTHLDTSQAQFGLTWEETRIGLRTRIPDVDDYWSYQRSVDRKLVGDTDRRSRKLIELLGAPLTFEWESTQSTSDFSWLVEAKKAQYSRTGKTAAPFFDQAKVQLVSDLYATKDSQCSGLLSVLRCGSRPIAAHFGLRCRDTLHVWFPVYDPELANYSPGRMLFKHMFCAARENGIRLFDRGEGDTQAKRDFANEEHEYGRGLWQATGWRGDVAKVALQLSWRLRA